jgi:SAM-dependent methyltransferase
MPSTYVFDNAADLAPARFHVLASMFDSGTIRHIKRRGIREGWSCLEVGGGGGSIAYWLSMRVGPQGRVLVTDLDTQHLDVLTALELPNLEVQRHDLTCDPLPDAAFDLVHARLVVMHLADKPAALRRMIAALKPGGWLVVEDFDSDQPIASSFPAMRALRRALEMKGVDIHWGSAQPALLRRLGLGDVDAEGCALQWRGGTPGAMLLRANYRQMRKDILDTGLLAPRELDAADARVDDPGFMMRSPIMWTAWGRRL